MGEGHSRATAALEVVQRNRLRLQLTYPAAFARFCHRYNEQQREHWTIRCDEEGDYRCAIIEMNGGENLFLCLDVKGCGHEYSELEARHLPSLKVLLCSLWKDYMSYRSRLVEEELAAEDSNGSFTFKITDSGAVEESRQLYVSAVPFKPYHITFPVAFADWCKRYDQQEVDGVKVHAGGEYRYAILDDELYLDSRGCSQKDSVCEDIERYKTVLATLWQSYREECPPSEMDQTVMRMQ